MREPVQDLDFLRMLHCDLSNGGPNYDRCMKVQREAESLTEQELRAMYSHR